MTDKVKGPEISASQEFKEAIKQAAFMYFLKTGSRPINIDFVWRQQDYAGQKDVRFHVSIGFQSEG